MNKKVGRLTFSAPLISSPSAPKPIRSKPRQALARLLAAEAGAKTGRIELQQLARDPQYRSW
jgi:hypothetical protein